MDTIIIKGVRYFVSGYVILKYSSFTQLVLIIGSREDLIIIIGLIV